MNRMPKTARSASRASGCKAWRDFIGFLCSGIENCSNAPAFYQKSYLGTLGPGSSRESGTIPIGDRVRSLHRMSTNRVHVEFEVTPPLAIVRQHLSFASLTISLRNAA